MDKRNSGQIKVACLGSSTTAAKGTFNWIAQLEQRAENKHIQFLNFGVGGDLAYNALKRTQNVIDAQPDKILIIIGSNDILAMTFANVRRVYIHWKHLPREPSAEWFRENLMAIIERLKQETKAQIGIASLAQAGEDPAANNLVQVRVNQLFKKFSEIIKTVAEVEGVSYIPFYERFHEQIVASPGLAFTKFSFLSFYRDYFWRAFILRYSFDKIAQINGWNFHVDGIHLNTPGGMILVNLVQEFLKN